LRKYLKATDEREVSSIVSLVALAREVREESKVAGTTHPTSRQFIPDGFLLPYSWSYKEQKVME
jgi:hypothetical protein